MIGCVKDDGILNVSTRPPEAIREKEFQNKHVTITVIAVISFEAILIFINCFTFDKR